jgi:hypothetical protein
MDMRELLVTFLCVMVLVLNRNLFVVEMATVKIKTIVAVSHMLDINAPELRMMNRTISKGVIPGSKKYFNYFIKFDSIF